MDSANTGKSCEEDLPVPTEHCYFKNDRLVPVLSGDGLKTKRTSMLVKQLHTSQR